MAEVDEQIEEVSPEEEETAPGPVVERVAEIPLEQPVVTEEPESKTPIKPKAKARGQRGKDKQPRAKPKPKARVKRVQEVQVQEYEVSESSSEESPDEATMEQIRAMHLIRSVSSFHQARQDRKRQMYASWFGR